MESPIKDPPSDKGPSEKRTLPLIKDQDNLSINSIAIMISDFREKYNNLSKN